jgi:sulfopyruvate decarboxylase TPP-binding subunit
MTSETGTRGIVESIPAAVLHEAISGLGVSHVLIVPDMNALRGVAIDMKVPTLLIVGQFGRDVSKTVEDNAPTGVRLMEPVLDAMDVPHYRLDFSEDVGVLKTAYERSRADRGPVVVLIGAPTA